MKLQMKNLTVNQLCETVNHVLDHASFQKALIDIRESFQKSGGYRQVADEIFKFKNQFNI